MLIDFCEIPAGNSAGKEQDIFELFARDLLESTGFEVVEGPARGADRRRDLIVSEPMQGVVSRKSKRWMVSAKHFAHSGRSVGDADENDPSGRVRAHKCDGFFGFYSTIASAGFLDTLHRLSGDIDYMVWDKAKISGILLANEGILQSITKRYFPKSFQQFSSSPPAAVAIASSIEPLACHYCGRSLLEPPFGIVAFIRCGPSHPLYDKKYTIADVYWSCRGECDKALAKKYGKHATTYWNCIKDLQIPLVYTRFITGNLRLINMGYESFEPGALNKFLQFVGALSQLTLRLTTEDQRLRIQDLKSIPEPFGGLG